jgi:ribosomal protein S18 acetylase RimI-like enzyme
MTAPSSDAAACVASSHDRRPARFGTAARGRGAGRRLLEELERRAVRYGAEDLVLDTNASLEAAGGLYRSSGFTEIEPYNANPNATHWYGKRVSH